MGEERNPSFHRSAASKRVIGRQSLSSKIKLIPGKTATNAARTNVPAQVGCTRCRPVSSVAGKKSSSVLSWWGPTSWIRLCHHATAAGQHNSSELDTQLTEAELEGISRFFFCCIAELAIKPCRSSRSNCAENSGFQTLAKQETKTPQSNKTPPNPKHNTTQKPASVWNVKREVRRG